jgi:hypothetical protein
MGDSAALARMPLAAMRLSSVPMATLGGDVARPVRIAARGGQMVPFGSVTLLPTPICRGDPLGKARQRCGLVYVDGAPWRRRPQPARIYVSNGGSAHFLGRWRTSVRTTARPTRSASSLAKF